MSVNPAALAAAALRDWLLWKLPAACVAVNATRAAVLRAPLPGPYTIPASAELGISLTGRGDSPATVPLTAGSRTAAQVAADIEAVLPGVASVDDDLRLVLTSTTAPSYTSSLVATDSCVSVEPDATGANEAIGWGAEGEWCTRTPVTPPGPKGVCDGLPLNFFFDPSQLGKGRVLVTIGERSSVARARRSFEHDVTLDVAIFRSEPQQVVHQSREHIQAALRAVQEALLTDAGAQLGRARYGDVQHAWLANVRISQGELRPTGADGRPVEGLGFDAVSCTVNVLVYQPHTP